MCSSDLDKWLRISVRRKLLDADLDELRRYMSGKVLEVGAGHVGRRGEFKPPFDNAESWCYINLSRAQSPDVLGDVIYPPLRGGTFDCILCLEVLEYVREPGRALVAMRRLLRPGGRLILSVPFMHRMDTSNDYWRFSTHGLVMLLTQAGFLVTEKKNQGAAFAVVVNILKYSLQVRQDRWREWRARLVRPILEAMIKRDEPLAISFATLASFTTGSLFVAELAPIREPE